MGDDVELYIGEGFAHVYLYDDEINDNTAKRVTSEIQAANADRTSTAPIVLHIHCRGGRVTSGLAILHAVRTSRRPVTTLVDGMAMSAAALILLGGGTRVMAPDAVVLFHETWFGVDDRAGEVAAWNAQMQDALGGMTDYILSRTRFTKAALTRLMRHDRILDAAACLRAGIVDRVLQRGRPLAATAAKAKAKAKEEDPAVYYSYCPSEDGGGSGDAFAEFDAFLRSVHRDPKPLLIHFGRSCDRPTSVYDELAWLARIHASRVPVMGVVNSPLRIAEALPFLACDRRTMYATGSILVWRMEDPQGESGPAVSDVVQNTALVTRLIKAHLRQHRVPAAVLASMDKEPYLITPRVALRWGLVDQVIA